MTKEQVVGERVYLAYTSTLLFITEGSQDRNSSSRILEAGVDAEALEGCCLLAYFTWLPKPAFYLFKDDPTHQGLGPPPLITN